MRPTILSSRKGDENCIDLLGFHHYAHTPLIFTTAGITSALFFVTHGFVYSVDVWQSWLQKCDTDDSFCGVTVSNEPSFFGRTQNGTMFSLRINGHPKYGSAVRLNH